MRQKVLLAILAGALLCTACGNTTAPDSDRQAEESSESAEEESTESEESTEERTEQTEEDASARLKKANFNNYVEVEYEPADYEEIVDDKPDYSGKHPWKVEVTEGASGVNDTIIGTWYTTVYEPVAA